MDSSAEEAKRALEQGNIQILDNMLKKKLIFPSDRIGRDGFTLLHWACFYGFAEALQKFLLHGRTGEYVKLVDIHGWSPVHVCAIRGHNNCIEVLLNHEADITIKDNRGYTCGHLASAHGNTYTLQTILKSGYNIEVKDNRQWTAVHHAAFHGRYGTLQILAKWNADLMCVDTNGNSPAHLAASEGHIDCLRLLVYYNHTPLLVLTSRNNLGATLKDLSIQFQKQECADFLSSAAREAELQEDNEENVNDYPCHKAASSGNLQLLSMLIMDGHTINQQDNTGSTPAHKAAGNGQLKCLQWLIEHGADISLKNKLKEIPMDVARKYANTECIAILGGGTGMDTDEVIDQSPETIDCAKEQIETLKRALTEAKSNYQQLGGRLEDEEEKDRKINEMDQKHVIIVRDLESKLELEKEKRELLERETDILRSQLHEANNTLLHYKSLLSGEETINKDDSSQNNERYSKRKNSGNRSYRTCTGGAYFHMNPNN